MFTFDHDTLLKENQAIMGEILFQVLFWIAILAIFHSYVLFPALLKIIARRKKGNQIVYSKSDPDLPSVWVIMSVFNEEKIIRQKLESVLQSAYPKEKLQIMVGSDASTDSTNSILKEMAETYPNLKISLFPNRSGKPNVINNLVEHAAAEILVLTDAAAIFERDTIFEMVKHFKNTDISLVGANLSNNQKHDDGIGFQEYSFMEKEIRLKNYEGLAWGCVIGAYGACFSIRKDDYKPVPPNYLVDDFFITMSVLGAGKKAIYDLDSKCNLGVTRLLKEEFRRKARIAAGNFQNLFTFRSLLIGPSLPVSFCYWSHKVLRWLGPFFIIAFLLSLPFLFHLKIYQIVAILTGFILLLPIIDYFLKKLGIHVVILRFVTHFLSMNAALLVGFFKFVKGVKTNAWQPTNRNE